MEGVVKLFNPGLGRDLFPSYELASISWNCTAPLRRSPYGYHNRATKFSSIVGSLSVGLNKNIDSSSMQDL